MVTPRELTSSSPAKWRRCSLEPAPTGRAANMSTADVLPPVGFPTGGEPAAEPSAESPGAEADEPEGVDVDSYEEQSMCSVCGVGDSWDEDQILFCDECNVPVHQACFGAGAREVPEGDWFCDTCRLGKVTGKKIKAECIFCPQPSGVLKRTSDARWAHVTCALWIPDAQFLDVDGRDIVHPYAVHPERLSLTCNVCGEQMGACVQCTEPKCLAAWHPQCARVAGVQMTLTEKADGEVQPTIYCKKHEKGKKKQKKRSRESKW